jgi:5'-3' exonuclease
MKRLVIVDALNALFLRNFVVNPSLDLNGTPIGGIVGSLKSLQKIIRLSNPDMVVIAWDGEGGSARKKEAVKSYKDGRKPLRLNHDIQFESEDDELENKIWQQIRLFEILNLMPIIQLMYERVEADDVIGHLVQSEKFSDWQKVIVSSDKDFFQLADDTTVIYRPIQDKVYNQNMILEEHGIHPCNFAVARSIAGDKSDNLPGIKGMGLPTVAKRFPYLAEKKTYLLDHVISDCKEQVEQNPKKVLATIRRISEQAALLRTNYSVMQLYHPNISIQTQQHIDSTIDQFVPFWSKTEFIRKAMELGFVSYSWNSLYTAFSKIVANRRDGLS